MDEIFTLPLVEVSRRLARRELSVAELTAALLVRIERLEPRLHSYASVAAEAALDAAAAADRERSTGHACGPLHGIPLGLKDIIAAAGHPTHVGSVALRDWNPGGDSTVARRLREAGAIIVGKHQTTEGACGDHHPSLTAPVNPWRAEAWTGVSSSGSAVATAAGLAFGSFGSDTGGSIRFPSHCCGLVGLKPSWGRVSRYGVFPLAESLDHVGPFGRSVADVALLFAAVAGADPHDPTTLAASVEPWTPSPDDARGLRVGFDPDYCSADVAAPVAESLRSAARMLAEAGASLVPLAVPALGSVVADWLIDCASQAATAHAATYPERAADYGPALTALLDYGRKLAPAVVAEAKARCRRFADEHAAIFADVDLYLSPVFHDLTPGTNEARARMRGTGLRRFVAFTAAANVCGCPTLSLPAGLDARGTPFGYQLVGRACGENALFSAGSVIEHASDWPRLPANL